MLGNYDSCSKMEEIEDEVVNIIGIDSDLLLFVEDDRSETLIKDDYNVEVEDNEKVESKPNEKKKRGRKKSLVKQLCKKENPVECGDCTKIFTTLRSLQRHKKFIHELNGLTNCDICGKEVHQGLGGLRKHKERVHEKLRDKCDLCENVADFAPAPPGPKKKRESLFTFKLRHFYEIFFLRKGSKIQFSSSLLHNYIFSFVCIIQAESLSLSFFFC